MTLPMQSWWIIPVNVAKNAWACQSKSCVDARGGKKGGNVLDFVAAMENTTVRDAAIRIANLFNLSRDENVGERVQDSNRAERNELAAKKKRALTNQTPASAENKPLGFALRIDHSHPYAMTRNLSPETVAHFGVGVVPGKGSMSGRFVIPIANGRGELVGYAGRAIDTTGNRRDCHSPGTSHSRPDRTDSHEPATG